MRKMEFFSYYIVADIFYNLSLVLEGIFVFCDAFFCGDQEIKAWRNKAEVFQKDDVWLVQERMQRSFWFGGHVICWPMELSSDLDTEWYR